MTPRTPFDTHWTELRRRAEQYVAELPSHAESQKDIEVARLIHEIRVNQTELEMQNEELFKSRDTIEVARHQFEMLYRKYSTLFDFAPVGYMVTDEAGLIQEANIVASILFDTPRSKLLGRRFTDFIHRDDQDLFYQQKRNCQKKAEALAFELKMKNASDVFVDVRLQLSPIRDPFSGEAYFSVALTDITELVRLSSSASLLHRCLELANTADSRAVLLRDFVQLIKTHLGCDAMGLRVRDADGDFPFMAHEGFSQTWVASESQDCLTMDACLCAMVINGTTDCSQPFFTPQGSFYINGIRRFLALSTATESEFFKSDCPARGYESMAVVPVAAGDTIFGLLHMADHRENQFPLRVVETLEHAASRLGLAIYRFDLQDHLHQSRKSLDELSRHLLTIQEEEQRRIAHDLHDGCGQNLSVLKLRITNLQRRLPIETDELNDEFNALLSLIDRIIDEVRSIAHGLKPAILERMGLVPASRQLFREFSTQYKVHIEKQVDLLNEIDDPTAQVCLYRIFQEALNNIYKHAQATWVLFSVSRDNEILRIFIKDNGIGFDNRHPPAKDNAASGMGLQAIALRCRMIGADLSIDSEPGKGTRLIISLQIPEKASSQ